MAIGRITSPSQWYQNTVVAPSWLQNVQDDINSLFPESAGVGLQQRRFEPWGYPVSAITALGDIAGTPWSLDGSGTTGLQLLNTRIGSSRGQKLTVGTSNGNVCFLREAHDGVNMLQVGVKSFMETTITLSAVGANSTTFVCGWVGGASATWDLSVDYMVFRKASTDTNWQLATDSSGSLAVIDSGVAPVAGTPQTMRIEHESVDAAGSGVVRYYIGGALVGTQTNGLPAGSIFPRLMFGGVRTGSVSNTITIGPIRWSIGALSF